MAAPPWHTPIVGLPQLQPPPPRFKPIDTNRLQQLELEIKNLNPEVVAFWLRSTNLMAIQELRDRLLETGIELTCGIAPLMMLEQ